MEVKGNIGLLQTLSSKGCRAGRLGRRFGKDEDGFFPSLTPQPAIFLYTGTAGLGSSKMYRCHLIQEAKLFNAT